MRVALRRSISNERRENCRSSRLFEKAHITAKEQHTHKAGLYLICTEFTRLEKCEFFNTFFRFSCQLGFQAGTSLLSRDDLYCTLCLALLVLPYQGLVNARHRGPTVRSVLLETSKVKLVNHDGFLGLQQRGW